MITFIIKAKDTHEIVDRVMTKDSNSLLEDYDYSTEYFDIEKE